MSELALLPNLLLLVLLLLCGAATVYVHRELTRRVPPGKALRNTRIVLGATALAFGWITARVVGLTSPGLSAILVFLTSATVVHVPAACILWLKGEEARQRRR